MPISFFKDIAAPYDGSVIRIDPPEGLKEFVEGYYHFKTADTDRPQLFFNDGYPVMAFMETADKKIAISDGGKATYFNGIWVCGGMLKNIYCESPDAFDKIFVVRFYPQTFFRLFDAPVNYFKKRQVSGLSELLATGSDKLIEAYYQCSSFEERLPVVSDFLSGRSNGVSYPRLLTDILKDIDKQEILTVSDLMKRYSSRLNYKWLERNFKAYIGLSPKNYFLLRRFLDAYIDLDSYTSKDLLKVAIDHGYYDDNHLIKDFKRFSGISPKKYFASL